MKSFVVALCIVICIVALFSLVDVMPKVDMPWDYGYIQDAVKSLLEII